MEYQRCLQHLAARSPELGAHAAMQELLTSKATLDECLRCWDQLLCDTSHTLNVAGSMRPYLLQIISSLVEYHTATSASVASDQEAAFCVALVALLEQAPHAKRLALQYFESRPSPMAYILKTQPQSMNILSGTGSTSQTDATALAFTSLLALQLAPELGSMWGTASFVQLLPHAVPAVRWAAAQSLARLLSMSCASKSHLLDQLLDPQQLVDVTTAWHAARAAAKVEMAAAWLGASPGNTSTDKQPLLEQAHQTTASAATNQIAATKPLSGRGKKRHSGSLSAVEPPAGMPAELPQPPLPPARSFVNVCGVDLPCRTGSTSAAASKRHASSSPKTSGQSRRQMFVATQTVSHNLQAAALALCSGKPLLLEGPPGSGKTALLDELAARTGNANDMVRIHLDDQMDAKSLLGSYMCTSVPGEFTWQPGPLTQAVTEGRWLLVEDINMAPPDILAALVPLLETGTLVVPSRGEVMHAADGFQLLATITSAPQAAGGGSMGAYATSNMAKELLGSLWAFVRVEPTTEVEQLAMLSAAYPAATPLLPCAVAALHIVQLAGGHLDTTTNAQTPTSKSGTHANATGADPWWHTAAVAALRDAGLRPGELALALPRHFSVRDLFKWSARMQSLHSAALGLRTVKKLSTSVESLVDSVKQAAATTSHQPVGSGLLTRTYEDSGMLAASERFTSAGYDITTVDNQIREASFVECADLYAALVAKPELRKRLLRALALLWGLTADQAVEVYEQLHKPTVQESDTTSIVVGRAVIDRYENNTYGSKPTLKGTFAHTGHALRYMEKVATAIAQSEPVLLVGETGTGKTTLVSRLAAMSGFPLVSFNMSAQTDSSDLLGGFKPVDARDALLPLLEPFMTLMRKTWTKGNNEEFLTRCAKYAERKKWSHLLQAYKTALAKVDALEAKEAAKEQASSQKETGLASTNTTLTDKESKQATKKRKKQSSTGKASQADGAVGSSAQIKTQETPADVSQQSAQDSVSSVKRSLLTAWKAFAVDVAAAERAAAVSQGGFAFSFVEGKLVAALRNGWWLLLDEINLAPPEVLERIAGLLEGPHGSITLVERGDTHTVPRHPSFRLIAAMNPATDAGKRELPAALRNRMTEIWVPEPTQREDLRTLVQSYLAGFATQNASQPTAATISASSTNPGVAALLQPVEACMDLYLAIKQEAEARLTDSAGQKPAYNLRTLSRALDYARTTAPTYGLQRALYDGFAMAFITQLSPESEPRVEALLLKHLLPGMKSAKPLIRTPPEPPGNNHVLFEHYWLTRGPKQAPQLGKDDDGSSRKFVLTASVRRHLCNLARAVLIRKHPILLQGPTSAGKTSLVAYLAAQSGHTLVRINNHEHTDLQEYLGSYVSDASGRLVFREGALVRAMRAGHWLVLDELNLAPSDVLEALNRLLDDNRELLVPELNEVVTPHPDFMLFATQNPPGAYAGRKALSRAFRSRFLELHVDELPDTELADILNQRCAIAPSYASKLVATMRELQRRRQTTNVFAGKHGFITPRDLFRWAERKAEGYQALAEDGALLLGERLRSVEERRVVSEVLAKIMNVQLNIQDVFTREGDAPFQRLAQLLANSSTPTPPSGQLSDSQPQGGEDAEALKRALKGVAWTRSMARMYTLVERCLRHQEPVLLVGETGTGKTTVCQLLALMRGQHLHIINCNQHTETSDFLGGFRPTRGREKAVSEFIAAVQAAASSSLWSTAGIAPPALPSSEPSLNDIMSASSLLQSQLASLQQWCASQPEAAQQAGMTAALAALTQIVTRASESSKAACAPFMWVDGPLITAMRRGDMILIDEINLAEDAVLERLNSVLEPGRTLTLAEKGDEGAEVITAAPGFRILATMNPGGDYGKKELSPALTNRFTSIWVPALEDEAELQQILEGRMTSSEMKQEVVPRLLAFWRFFKDNFATPARAPLSARDLLAWANFITTATSSGPKLEILPAYVHGAHLVLLDGLGLGVGLPLSVAAALRKQCCTFLRQQLPDGPLQLHAAAAEGDISIASELHAISIVPGQERCWGIHPFYVTTNHITSSQSNSQGSGTSVAATASQPKDRAAPGASFELSAPTSGRNAYRVLRALTLSKAVLLEGSPGVGKTALIAALAKQAGIPLVRINLSEQTDMMDLLGADLPAPGGQPGQFTWCDGPLLGALKNGAWVLLDELNLAGQSVLEGLNALLDHRAEVFIPELGSTFHCHKSFRLFAAQNPVQEGGGRKGLPRSFLNRFTRVQIEMLHSEDLMIIAGALYPRLPADLLQRMVGLLEAMQKAANLEASGNGTATKRRFATQGGPWEFNLRDLLRWADLINDAVVPVKQSTHPAGAAMMDASLHEQQNAAEAQALDEAAEHFVHMLFRNRLRTAEDRTQLDQLWQSTWGRPLHAKHSTPIVLSPDMVCVGRALLPRRKPAALQLSQDEEMNNAMDVDVDGDGNDTEDDAALQLEHAGEVSGQGHALDEALHLLTWQLPVLEGVMQTLSRGWMALLVGGPASGKTRLARLAARLAGQKLTELAMTTGTDTSDLLGSFEQVQPSRQVQEAAYAVHHLVNTVSELLLTSGGQACWQACSSIQAAWQLYCELERKQMQSVADNTPESHMAGLAALTSTLTACSTAAATLPNGIPRGLSRRIAARHQQLQQLQALLSDESQRAVAGRFEWVDGTLSRAISHGGWVLLDNANLCNPTVLDRLNPLLEPGGSLFLAEAGSVGGQPRVIKPHPNFRLILAMDPRHGEVSRAMRNRGIELFLLPPSSSTPAASLLPTTAPVPNASNISHIDALAAYGQLWHDAHAVISAEGPAGPTLIDSWADCHVAVCSVAEAAHRKPPSLVHLKAWVVLARGMLQRGSLLGPALAIAWKQAYISSLVLGATELATCQDLLRQHLGHYISPALMAAQPDTVLQLLTDSDSEPMNVDDDHVQAGQLPNGAHSSSKAEDELATIPEVHQLDLTNRCIKVTTAGSDRILHMPCIWPQFISGLQLADSTLAGLLRDVSPVAYAAAVAASVSSAQFKQGPGSVSQRELLPYLTLRSAAAHLGVQSTDSAGASQAATTSSMQLTAQLSIWHAVPIIIERALSSKECDMRARLIRYLSDQFKGFEQIAGDDSAASVAQLLQLAHQAADALKTHSTVAKLNDNLKQYLKAGGANDDVMALQPFNPSYNHAAHTYTAAANVAVAMTSISMPAIKLLWLQWHAAATAVQQALLQHFASQQADVAVAGGSAAPYQLSVWRQMRPELRALQDAPHPVIDHLDPVLRLITRLEEQLTALPDVSVHGTSSATSHWTAEMAVALQRVAVWRWSLWSIVHGPLHISTSSEQPHEINTENITWVWAKLSKHVQQLTRMLPSQLESAASELLHALNQGCMALLLDSQQPKPLLWHYGGHPVLPREQSVLQAQLAVQQLSVSCASKGSTTSLPGQATQHGLSSSRLLDAQGYPAQLVAAGINAESLIEAALQRNDLYWDPMAEGAATTRECASAAVAATLLVNPNLRDALASGSALLTFVPAAAALKGSDMGVQQATTVPALLREQIESVASQAADDALQLDKHSATDVSILGPLKPNGMSVLPRSSYLLPVSLMSSESVRSLQARLLAMHDLTNLRIQPSLLADAQHVLMQLTLQQDSASNGTIPSQLLIKLRHALQAHMQHGLRGTARSPTDFASHQQLLWLLEALQPQPTHLQQQHKEAQQYLVFTVLPAVLSNMWLTWQSALWASSCSSGLLLTCGESSAATVLYQQQSASHPSGPAMVLHTPSQATAAAAVVLDCASAVREQAVRLLQLRLSAAQLLRVACQHQNSKPAPAHVILACNTWKCLTGLLSQILWSHTSSLSSTDAKMQLVTLLQQLMHLAETVCMNTLSHVPTHADSFTQLTSLISSISDVLQHSNHTLLHSLQQPLLQPALLVLRDGLLSLSTLAFATSQADASHATAQQQLLQGRAWVLVGALRLHLVTPPLGIDPAGKYRLKAMHLQAVLRQHLSPEISVRHALAALPGGPDESRAIQDLLTQRDSTIAQLENVLRQCVPRPDPPQYQALASEVRDFVQTFASVQRLTQLLSIFTTDKAQSPNLVDDAIKQAVAWTSSAKSWSDRLSQRFPMYCDIVQPVQAAVQELCHGWGLLAATPAASITNITSNPTSAVLVIRSLMAYPTPTSCSTVLADPSTVALVSELSATAARAAANHFSGKPEQVTRSADMAAFTAGLQVRHAALRMMARELLHTGPVNVVASTDDNVQSMLAQWEQLLSSFLAEWAALKAYEEKVAAEEAEMFKTKTRSTHIANEEEEAEAEYKKLYPDWSAPFANLPGMDDDSNDLMRVDEPQGTTKGTDDADSDAAAAAQASTAAARQLLDGQMLSDIVQLHSAVYKLLGSCQKDRMDGLPIETIRQNFTTSYHLGAQLLSILSASQQPINAAATGQHTSSCRLDVSLDDDTLTGHLYRTALEAVKLSETAAPTAAAAVAVTKTKRSRAGAGDAADVSVDILAPCVAEIVLLQEPVGTVARRVAALLEEFPEHAVLAQLAAIAGRLLGLSLDTPLKTALTGLELLLARAQVWEETAAKHVSIKAELTSVAGLATRWRKLELSSWQGTLQRVVAQHAAGANRSWFYLYQLLLIQPMQADGGLSNNETAAVTDGSTKDVQSGEGNVEDRWFKTTVSTLEAFIQTSTIGEYAARLQLLSSFKAHLQVRMSTANENLATTGSDATQLPEGALHARYKLLVAALTNIIAYYAQFQPRITEAIQTGLAPHEKDLSDFVALAKWEDRGFYAMKASTEKAQRHLHKLRRRGEEVLKQPAAGVLAQAMKNMGISEYAAAATMHEQQDTATATTTDAKDASGNQNTNKPAKPILRRRRVKKSRAATSEPVTLLQSQPTGLDITELEGSDTLDPVQQPTTWSAWQKLTSAAVAAVSASMQGVAAPVTTAVQANGTSSIQPHRLPHLAKRMANLLNRALRVDPTTTCVIDLPEMGDEDAGVMVDDVPQTQQQADEILPAAVAIDDLACIAASRAAALRGDQEKGCRLRKKKALTDFLHALSEIGLSKRQADIPRGQRTVSDWFKQTPPDLTPLLKRPTSNPAAGASQTASVNILQETDSEMNEAWSKGEAYYLRSVARIQKLWSVKTQAHKDISLSEANAITHMCEHVLLVSRRQRSALGHAANSAAALQQLTGWLSHLHTGNAAQSATEGTNVSRAASAMLPHQAMLHWATKQKACLDSLTTALADMVELLSTCSAAGCCDGIEQLQTLQQASTNCKAWHGHLVTCKHKLDACMSDMQLTGVIADCTWVSDNVQAIVTANFNAIAAVSKELYSYLDVCVKPTTDTVEGWVPPGLPALAAAFDSAVVDATTFAQDIQRYFTVTATPATPNAPIEQNNTVETANKQFSSCLEAAISSILVWCQEVTAATEAINKARQAAQQEEKDELGMPASNKQACSGLPTWTTGMESVMQLPLTDKIVKAFATLLNCHTNLTDQMQGNVEMTENLQQLSSVLSEQRARLASLAPMLQMVDGVLQLQAARLLNLHRATAKLSYITTSLFATLLEDGFCAPQEGDANQQGGEGAGEFKEVEGTGMGEGDTTGAKDVSDKITDEDQLLGAQQKDQQQQQGQEEKEGQQQDEQEDDKKGIEMEADFDGELHDMKPDEQQDNDMSEEDEEGDDDRIDQQMGDAGDDAQRVDEKLWADEDENEDEAGGQQDRKEEQGDGPIQVDDKKDLEYEAQKGQPEDEEQPGKDDKQNKEAPKKEQKKQEQQGGVEQGVEVMEEEEHEEEEGGVNDGADDVVDKPEDHVKPEAPEAELELPQDMNLDGVEEEEQGQEEQQGAGEEDVGGGEDTAANDTSKTEEDQGAGQDEQQGDGKDQDDAAGGDDDQGQEQPGGDQQGGDDEQQQEQEQQEAEGAAQEGIGEVLDQEQLPEEDQKPDEDIPPTAAHGMQDESQPQPLEQQAGPKGVASAAVTQQGDQGKTQKPTPQAAPLPAQTTPSNPEHETAIEETTADQANNEAAPQEAASDTQPSTGQADASDQGQIAPFNPGATAPAAQQPQKKSQRGQEQKHEANPLRDLGDALEKWRANLSVQHDVAEQEGGGGEEDQGPDDTLDGHADDTQPTAAEYQYLGQNDAARQGDTQALAPATEEQAHEVDEATRQQQMQDEDVGQEDDQAMAVDEDMGDAGKDDKQNPAMKAVAGNAPKQWQGAQKDAKMAGDEIQQEEEGGNDEETSAQKDGLAEQLASEMNALFMRGEQAVDDTMEGDASLAIAQLTDMQVDEKADEVVVDEPTQVLGLSEQQVSELRADLDEKLRHAGQVPDQATDSDESAALQRYGAEVWARCDALTAGLAGELSEQLRLILEPTLASRLAGDFRTGKRISMRKVIAYIASHYRKDKIWLRRSRPDKRRYQVVLAVDDSRSMAECGCGGVALEALTLLCKALSRLEVGQIGVVKFGGPGGAQPLHALTQPFTDAAGPGIMSSLRFKQDNTIADQPMLRLVEALDHMLSVARHQGGAGGIGAGTQDLAQLALIVADGRLHEKDALRARVRELLSKRGVCVVFIAIDSPVVTAPPTSATAKETNDEDGQPSQAPAAAQSKPQSSVSLLDMQAVSFQGGKPVFKRYLDDFPFPYYVLLRDISALPRTLADLLKQWLEMSAAGGSL